jgi:hypothetical protein
MNNYKLAQQECKQWLLAKEKNIKPRNSKTGKPRYGQNHFLIYRIDTNYNNIEQLPEYLQDEIWDMEGEEVHNRDGILPNHGTGEHIEIHVDDWNGNQDITIKWRRFIKTVYEEVAE